MSDTIRLDDAFADWDELLALILASFDYMHALIDPPSSALKLTPQSLRAKALEEIAFVIRKDGTLAGCVFLRPEPGSLYIGKLAVAPAHQGTGIGQRLLQLAEETAHGLGLRELRLDTRIELTGNHSRFAGWGFRRTAEKSHPGYERITFVEMRKTV